MRQVLFLQLLDPRLIVLAPRDNLGNGPPRSIHALLPLEASRLQIFRLQHQLIKFSQPVRSEAEKIDKRRHVPLEALGRRPRQILQMKVVHRRSLHHSAHLPEKQKPRHSIFIDLLVLHALAQRITLLLQHIRHRTGQRVKERQIHLLHHAPLGLGHILRRDTQIQLMQDRQQFIRRHSRKRRIVLIRRRHHNTPSVAQERGRRTRVVLDHVIWTYALIMC